ncbi:MAG: flagellar basal body L-ring protein FlgH [Proteobacteria bacterium]|nr:flagellar basal body L-ring protein FlgH [Pseudomonadota bacterium]
MPAARVLPGFRSGLVACAAGLLAACAAIQPAQIPPLDDGSRPNIPVPAPRKARAGGVFSGEQPWASTADSRAFRPGDVLTVQLEETTQASKSADTAIDKKSGATLAPVTLFGKAVKSTGLGFDANRNFAGNASSRQQNTLQGAITVIVQEVLPNGLLRVSGEKSLYLNQGEELLRLAGYVRASDIDTENRVSSLRIANARIAYSGRGTLADANEPGWLNRFFNSPWSPF